MAVTRFRGFLTSEIPEPWSQATRPETLAHIAAEYGTTADRLVRHTVVEVPETVLTMGMGPMDAFPVPRRLRSSDDGEPCRLRGFPGSDALLATLVSLQETGRPLPFWEHVWTRQDRPAQS